MRRGLIVLMLAWAGLACGQTPTGHFAYAFTTNFLWDLTGSYTNGVGVPDVLIIDLQHFANGALTGDRMETNHVDSNNYSQSTGIVYGTVSTEPSAVMIHTRSKGRYSAVVNGSAVTAEIKTRNWDEVDPGFLLLYPVRGTIRICPGMGVMCTNTFPNGVPVSLPATMDGSWSLDLDLVADGTKLSGTGVVTLSNARTFAYTATGSYNAPTARLKLRGDGEATGTSLSLVAEGPSLTITRMKGRILGQKIVGP